MPPPLDQILPPVMAPPAPTQNAPIEQPPVPQQPEADPEGEIVVRKEILDRIDDSLRVEREWRKQGQTVQQIFRGELTADGKPSRNAARYNILNANTGVLLPSLFSKNPNPDIRARGFQSDPVLDMVIDAISKITSTFMDNTETFDAFKKAVKEVLLPGRGIVRVRWDPIVEETQQDLGNGVQVTVHEKLLDILGVEHVYWEDFTHEQVSSWEKCGWEAFRHLFTKKQFEAHFGETPAYQKYVSDGKVDEIFRWTDKQAYQAQAKASQNSRSSSPASGDLQDVIRKAMVWEYWDKNTREIVWICQDMDGSVLRIDPDPLRLRHFFPNPCPLLGITTTDKMLPVPEYQIYQDLAIELDKISARINALTDRLKVRGAYNGAQEELGRILKADDGEMIPVNGIDYNNDVEKQVYILKISEIIQALNQLYQARVQAKESLNEVTGISDIVRGETRASETLGAQKMKAGFATLRLQDRKAMVEFFCRDTIKIMVEIVAEHFSPESIMYYTGVMLTEEAFQMMRNDAMRISRIDVESDSTVAPDEQADQQQIGMMLQALAQVMQQILPMVQSGMMPMPIALELMKMVTKPFKYATQFNQLINQYIAMMMGGGGQQPGMMGPPPGGPVAAEPPSGQMAPGQNMPRPGGTDNRML